MKYRGIMHAHSTHSYDGKLSLSELKALLQTAGYSFACMTEHTDTMTAERAAAFVAECRSLSDHTFVFVPGFEVPYGRAHVLHIGAAEFVTGVAATAADLEAWRRVTPLVILAHPVRNHFMVDSALQHGMDGIEIWNQQYDGKLAPRTNSARLLGELRQVRSLFATGGSDLHRAEHLGGPATVLELTELTTAAILGALMAGSFSFGTEKLMVPASAPWQPTFLVRLRSACSCAVIKFGKTINRGLALIGVRVPKQLLGAIRRRV